MSEDSSFGEEIQCSKGLFLCSAADAASTIDYSKAVDINDGVVDSPPSRGAPPTSMTSPSPLRTQTWTPSCRDRSPSLTQYDPNACRTPQRKLYGGDGVGESRDQQILYHKVTSKTLKPNCANGPFKVQKVPSICPSMFMMKEDRFGDGAVSHAAGNPLSALKRGKGGGRRQSLPLASLANLRGSGYRYSRRDDIMRGLEKLRGGSTSEKGVCSL